MSSNNSPLSLILEELDIPDSAYDRAESRYKNLYEFLCRSDSRVANLDPYIFPQGSFLLGTVTRPHGNDEEYDLDLGCSLRSGVSKSTHTQKELKELIGKELEDYRRARQIQHELESKQRCWRLSYQDELPFHMDVVPCIPERAEEIGLLKRAMMDRGIRDTLASEVASRAVSITDEKRLGYDTISPVWLVSNMEGYAQWFQSRVELARQVRERMTMEKRAEIAPIPDNRRKAPLQRVVQLLKRHRDVMFADNSASQPISIIITTLAARAYGGEDDIETALANVLAKMRGLVQQREPRVPNPVNPREDFADKWGKPEYRPLNLEGNFDAWLTKAQIDFSYFAESKDPGGIEKRAEESLSLNLNRDALTKSIGTAISVPAIHTRTTPISNPPRQWGRY